MESNTILQGDCLEKLKELDSESIDCVITSPPYWGLRDYGVEGQLGLEKTLDEFIGKLLVITAELKRVLKPTGIMFWNHGDCYSAQRWTGSGRGQPINKFKDGHRDINPEKNSGLDDKTLVLQNYKLIIGSGTTAVVAKKLGRNWLGIELNPDYIKIAKQRIRTQPVPLL